MNARPHGQAQQLDIAVIGGGISGLSAAWLLSQRHRVTLYEEEARLGGHSHTVDAAGTPVDTGFIVYNEPCYPNLTALFAHLDVPTQSTEMTFAVSLDDGRLEYSGTGLNGLFAQRRNLFRPRFWSMLRDLVRFYRTAPADIGTLGLMSLGDYLDRAGYGEAFRADNLYPTAAAIWSTPAADIAAYPAAAFIRFFENHGLLNLGQRPVWRTVVGGSRNYVSRLAAALGDDVRLASPVQQVRRTAEGDVVLTDAKGREMRHDQVVIAAHADQALAMLADASTEERRILSAFRYQANETILHSDTRLMPKNRRVWSSWNYATRNGDRSRAVSVTYWMNLLQHIPHETPLFVTLNPLDPPDPARVILRQSYQHPLFNAGAMAAQAELWSLQGRRNTWFCGAYFGAGFHEDGLQAGLAVAEQLGGVRRPWQVANESGRICLPADGAR